MIHPARRPFPDGDGIFETLRTENGKVGELGRHMRRALRAANALGISMPDEEVLRLEIVAAMELSEHSLGRLRICISNKGFSVTHDEYIELAEGGFLTFSQRTSTSDGEQFKSYPYDSHFEVVDEARAYGFDDAIIFNRKNNVTETGISNLVLRINDRWVTPPIGAGLLPGVMRGVAIDRCGVEVRNVHISEIADLQELFLLSSMKIAQPVAQVGEHRLPCGEASQLFEAQMREKVEFFSVG